MSARIRLRLAAALCWVPLLIVIVVVVRRWPLLGQVLPSQWHGTEVSSTAPGWTMLSMPLIGALLVAIVAPFLAFDGAERPAFFWCFGLGAMFASIALILSVSILVVPSAPEHAPWLLASPLAILLGFVAARIAPPHGQREHPGPVDGEPELQASPATSSQGVWRGQSLSKAVLGVGAVIALLVAGGVVVRMPGSTVPATIIGFSVALVLLFATLLFAGIRVEIDARGLRVRSLLLPITLRRLPLADIASASADRVSAARWGIGFRMGSGGHGFIVRSGPALRVVPKAGTPLTVSVDEAPIGAAMLQHLLNA